MKHGEQYCCKRWRMLSYLVERGFKPIKAIPDCTRADYKNWIFQNSDELEDAINEYFENLAKK